MTRQLPPRETWVPYTFIRAEAFYIIDLPQDEDLTEHVALNPGTVRIEDMHGNVLWSLQ